MAGPWEDFKGQESPPWQDFQAPVSRAPLVENGPWQDFARPSVPVAQAPQTSNPGMTDYLGEIGKQVAHGGVDALITSRLRGIAGQIYEPDTSVSIPQPPPGGYRTEAEVPELPVLPVTQSTPYRAAQATEDFMKSTFPDRNILNPVVRDVSSGVGSVIGNVAGFMVPGTRGFGISTTPAQGAGESVERAVKAGATEDQVRRAASLGNVSGATEFADAALPMLGSVGKTLGFIQRVGIRAAIGAFTEGGQEGLQQFIQNMIAKGVYNPKQDLTEDVAYNALIGAIVGGGVGGVMPGRQAVETPPSQETIEAAGAAVPPTDPSSPPAPTQVVPTPLPPDIYGDVTVGEPPIPKTVEEVKATSIPPEIVDFVQSKVEPPLTAPSDPSQLTLDGLLAPAKEEITSSPGANTARLAKLLGPKLYGDPSNIAWVSVKEMFQNAFDAVKTVMERGEATAVGNIDIRMDPQTRTITITDDGSGMTPQVLGRQFLEIAGTQKESKRASGGLGIAKMLFIFGNKNLKVTTMRDGKVSELVTTGEQLFSALDDKSKAPQIQIRTATGPDLALFPKGHGTRVEVLVPQTYTDPSTGEQKEIPFRTYVNDHSVLTKSPLFGDINVKMNGRLLDLGSQFPLENFTQFSNVKFDWGTARIYISREQNPNTEWENNVHVLSNGLWQFSGDIKADLMKPYGKNIPYDIYIDVNSKALPEEPGYPFDLNRQGFSPQAKKGFANIFNYIGLVYQQNELANSASNFGTMQFLDYDTTKKTVTASSSVNIEPKVPVQDNPFSAILARLKKGKSFKVVEGQLIVDGIEVPELKPQELAQYKIDVDELRIDQSEIDPDRIILHDNIVVKVSESEERTITDYGRERFGKRFDEFTFAIGAAFKELRDIVVKGMPKHNIAEVTPPLGLSEKALALWTEAESKNGYEELGREGIGISFDQEYRGVSIKLPFSGMFLNPAVPEYNDPLRAAVGMVGTMVHELAHYKVRFHEAEFPAEMQRIIIMLDTHPTFNYHGFKQKVINIVAAYNDVFSHLNGVFTSGNFDVRPRGKRFTDSGSNETRDGGVAGDLAGFGRESESGQRLSFWHSASQTIPEAGSGRGTPANQTGPSGSSRPSDNGRGRNYASLRPIDSGISAPPQQPEVNALRNNVSNVLANVGGASTPEVKEAAAHADRMNWFYKYMAGVLELLDANPYFLPLRKYVERVRAMHTDETKVHDAALRIMKDWRHLGEQNKNLEAFILDLQAMPYLTPGERSMNLWRHPTTGPGSEFEALVRKHKLSDEALKLYTRIRTMDEVFLKNVEQVAIEKAIREITDPVKLAARLDEIRATGRLARAQPFFPFTRFGRYYVSVTDAAGKVVHFETFEPKRFGGFTIKRAEKYQNARVKALEKKVAAGHKVTAGVLPETAEPFVGMPVVLLQIMSGELGLTVEQVAAIKLLQSQRNPTMTMNQRAVYGDPKIPGYSLDLQRSFARYYFHGGRYLAKAKHLWALHGHIAEAQLVSGNKAGLITSYMSDHLQHTVLDARGDFGFFRGAIFLWTMGYVPAAATQNLTQTPMITLPFLMGKFGDLKAPRAILKAMAQLSSFYKRGTYENMSGFEMEALDYGVKTGRISETQATELAGIAGGGILLTGQGGTATQRAAVGFQEKAAWMFEMAEQFNRRIAYRATLTLAKENPTAKFVEESVRKYPSEYAELVAKFGNEADARAVVTAIHAVDQTQYVYSKYARPRFMRGALGSILFVFKRYMQSTLFMLGHNKADVLPRYLVIAMLMGGLGGIPGYEDMAGLFRAFAKWFFGKDADPNRLVREYVLQWFDGKLPPDLVLHGLARRGFGLPGLLDMMGSSITGQPGRGLQAQPATNVPFPILDRSKALSMGNILPFDIGKLVEPTDKLEKTMADQTQKASGAVFSVGFNIYKALMDQKMEATDPKRWEKAVPRALGSASRMYRAFSEGRERSRGGPTGAATIISYDVRDTEQMMEALALGGGYQPLRLQQAWDRIIAKVEVTAYFDLQRKRLLEQYFEAQKGQNKNEITKVRDEVIQFNKGLPDWAKGKVISGDTISRSMQGRERTLRARETGIPAQKSNVGISKHIDQLFPESTIDVKRVR